MKLRKFLSIMLLAVVALTFVACGKDNNKPVDDTKITEQANEYLNKIAITYAQGDSATSVTKDVTLGTATAEGLTVTWTSNNAAITKDGKVTQGEADVNVKLTVTVKYQGITVTKDFDLVVKAKAVEVIEPVAVEVTGAEKVTVGADIQLTAAVKPDTATAKEVEWATSDATIATVDATGKVTGVAAGTVKITATVKGYAAVKAEYTVTVEEPKDPEPETIAATLAKEAGAEGWIKGTVVGTYKRGFMVYDGTGYILVYMNKTEFTQTLGDFVEVKGELGEFNGAKQFTDSCTLTALTEGTPYKLNATTLDDAGVKALIASFEYAKKIKVRVTIDSASDSYVNATVKDGESGIAITYPMDKDAYEVGADYDVTGLALYTNEYNGKVSVYVMVEKATKVDYGFEVSVTYKDGDAVEVEKINSLQFPVFELKEPTAKEGYVFRGWYKGTPEAPVKVTSLLLPEDIELFAIWVLEADAPLVVNPEAEEGSGEYKTISAALEAATEGQTIELLAGDYAETTIIPADPAVEGSVDQELSQIVINKKVTIIGPNANVHGHSEDRADEANITVKFIIEANGVVLNGLAFNAEGNICLKAVSDVVIDNCNIATETYKTNGSGNRAGMIYSDGEIHNFVIKNSYLCASGTSYTTEWMSFGDNVDGFTMDNCYGENTATTLPAFEGILFYRMSGVFNITNNETHFGTDGYLFWFGYYANTCTEINIKSNVFANNGDLYTVTIGFRTLSATAEAPCTINFMNNELIKFAPSTLVFGSTGTGAANTTVNYMYNFFDGEYTFKCTYLNGVKINHDYNCTLGELNSANALKDIKEEAHALSSAEECHAMYAIATGNVQVSDTEYTITFDSDGGSECAAIKYNDYSKVVLPTPTKEGYKFAGWYNGETAVSLIYKYEDVTLKAAWDKIYTVTFDSDGGSAVEKIYYTNAADVELPTPTKAGHAFEGWYNGETKVEALTENADYTLKAAWRAFVDLEVGEGKTYTTIAAALEAAKDGDTVKVYPGTYAENLTLDKNITLTSAEETKAELTGVITLGVDLECVKVTNLKFSGAAQIKSTTGGTIAQTWATFNTLYFEFSGNEVVSALTEGRFIDGTQGDKLYAKYVINNNSFKATEGWAAKTVIYLVNQYDLEMKNNLFEGFKVDNVIDIEDTDNGKGLTGDVVNVNGNEFKTITGNAIHVNWLGKLASTKCYYNFNNNTYDVTGTAFEFNKTNASESGSVINVNGNVFKAVGTAVSVARFPNTVEFNFNGNYFAAAPTTAYFAGTNAGNGKVAGLLLVNDGENIAELDASKVAAYSSVTAATSYADFLDACEEDSAAYAAVAPKATGYYRLSAADKAAIAKVNPTKYVSTKFEADKTYSINGVDVVVGTNGFASLADAFGAAADDDVFYLFAGNYTAAACTKSVTVAGPNAGLAATAERNPEAVIVAKTYAITVPSMTFNGVELTGAGNNDLLYANAAGKVRLESCYLFDANSLFRVKAAVAVEKIDVINCKFGKITQFIIWTQQAGCSLAEFNMIGCLYDATNGSVGSGRIRLSNGSNAVWTIKDNYFDLAGQLAGAAIVANRTESGVINVVGNTFKGDLVFVLENGDSAKGTVNFDGNLFLDKDGNVVADVSSIAGNAALTVNMGKVAANDDERKEALKEPVYATAAAVAEAFMADYNAKNGKSLTAAELDSSTSDSDWLVAVMKDADLKAKWMWLYKALYTVGGGAEAANPEAEGQTFEDFGVKGFYLTNLCGFFTGTQHTDGAFGKSFDWTSADAVAQVLAAGPKA